VVRAGVQLYGDYAEPADCEIRWRDLVARLGGSEQVAGHSVEGRPLWRFDVGPRAPGAPVVLLTALMHGVELIGAAALFDVIERLAERHEGILEAAHLVIIPVVNPDAFAANMERLGRGRPAFQRKNAAGVDLNRNFPAATAWRSLHPCSGSSFRASPYYRGPRPFSEPETRVLRDVVTAMPPALALGFHSFGNSLLWPWGHSRVRSPRHESYRRLADAFLRTLPTTPYRCRQASELYPTVGDLDDWLDVTYGTAAFTVEASGLDERLLHPLRFINPFCWMNPSRVQPTVANLSPGVIGLVAASLAALGLAT
jgi:carboxypeptidase T